jgi:hypothetical protein
LSFPDAATVQHQNAATKTEFITGFRLDTKPTGAVAKLNLGPALIIETSARPRPHGIKAVPANRMDFSVWMRAVLTLLDKTAQGNVASRMQIVDLNEDGLRMGTAQRQTGANEVDDAKCKDVPAFVTTPRRPRNQLQSYTISRQLSEAKTHQESDDGVADNGSVPTTPKSKTVRRALSFSFT